MSAHGRVAKSFWTRSARRWSDDEKLLALYLLTGPHHTLERFYRLPLAYVSDDLGWPAARVRKVMGSLEAREFAAYDRDAQVVLVVKGLAYQAPKGEKQITGALRVLAEVPPTPLLGRFLEAAEEHAPEFAERASKQYPHADGYPIEGVSPRAGDRARAQLHSNSNPPNGHVRPEPDETGPDPVRRVFDAWIASTGRTGQTQLSPKRRRLITAALKGYPLDDVLDAVKGWRQSAHHRGENQQRTVYNDLELLLRDAEHIERFRDLQRGARQPTAAGSSSEFVARRGAAA